MFDAVAGSYDRLVDWPRRLAREAPFFHALFARHEVRRVLDVGCGTGHHAAMFHGWGLDVTGMDISREMLEECNRLHGGDERLRWVEHAMDSPKSLKEPFDAVVCIGNTLALSADAGPASDAVRWMLSSVRPGGIGIIQVLNLAAIQEGPIQWQKVRRYEESGQPAVAIKGVHRIGSRGYVEVMNLQLPSLGVQWQPRSAALLGLTRRDLEGMIRDGGGEISAVYGSYGRDDFSATGSADLIVVWWRVRCG